jgi:hypothetical protein
MSRQDTRPRADFIPHIPIQRDSSTRGMTLALPRATATTHLGVEHEYRLWRGDEQVDFRRLISLLAHGIRPLDPGDRQARRLPSGVALTAHGWEAELATPPLPVSAAAPGRVDDLLRGERTELRDTAAAYEINRVSGFTTHLNISVPFDRVVEIARSFSDTCLLALATVIEPSGSRGLQVRPLWDRLEIAGDYVEGPDLIAGQTLLAACVRGLAEGSAPTSPYAARTVAARGKFGWFMPPGQVRDIDALVSVWTWARTWAVREGLDPAPVDELVQGSRAPRRKAADGIEPCTFALTPGLRQAAYTGPRSVGDGISAETEWLTREHVVWRFRNRRGHQCRAVVPVEREPDLLDHVDSGALTSLLTEMMRADNRPRRLLVHAQIGDGGLWHDVRPQALVPAERRADGTAPRASVRAARRSYLRAQQMAT